LPTMIWRLSRRTMSRHGRMDMPAHIRARTPRRKPGLLTSKDQTESAASAMFR
jgi:hypothetical protein